MIIAPNFCIQYCVIFSSFYCQNIILVLCQYQMMGIVIKAIKDADRFRKLFFLTMKLENIPRYLTQRFPAIIIQYSRACTIKHYGFVMRGFRNKLVCLSKLVKVFGYSKNTSLLQICNVWLSRLWGLYWNLL
jgi:hypothetical protein